VAKDLTFADAVKILGTDAEEMKTFDAIFSGAISAATATHSPAHVIDLLKATKLVADRSLGLVRRVSTLLGKTRPHRRHEVLSAAHTVVAISAFFEALTELEPEFATFNLTRAEKLQFVSADDEEIPEGEQDNGEEESSKKMPMPFSLDPIPHLTGLRMPVLSSTTSSSSIRGELQQVYEELAARVERFIVGLSAFDVLDAAKAENLTHMLLTGGAFTEFALERYDERLVELAALRPEFFVWLSLTGLRAASSEQAKVGRALERISEFLAEIHAAEIERGHIAVRLAKAYRAELARPLLDTGEAHLLPGRGLPTLTQAYIDPAYRLTVQGDETRAAEDRWWQTKVEQQEDLAGFLSWHLSTASAFESPLLVLGHPGAGKSLLTKVLAAQCAGGAFAPVRVELRHVSSDASLLDQIEEAMRSSLHEAVGWAQFSREAAHTGAIPLLILDGLDELLQAGSTARSDYLASVAEFQRVEAVQDRPLAAVVTSRTLVMTQSAIPRGCTIVRIEPFDDRRIAAWVGEWNRLAALEPSDPQHLAIDTVRRYPDLAAQPLLLLLLALYNADPGHAWTGPHGTPLEIHGLYEGLLRQFAHREVMKRSEAATLDARGIGRLVEAELDVLALVAFSMFNRGAQSVSLADLDRDLAALSPRNAPLDPWTQGQAAIGRFFFIHESQALSASGAIRRTYEFLHATFAEFLVARKVVSEAMNLLRLRELTRASHTVLHGEPDGLLHALLSYSSLISRGQVLDFLEAGIAAVPDSERAELALLAVELFKDALQARPAGAFEDYRPVAASAPARHAAYSLNLLVLLLAASDEASRDLDELFAGHETQSCAECWGRTAQLWRAALPSEAWENVVSLLSVADGRIRYGQLAESRYEFLAREAAMLSAAGSIEPSILMRAIGPLASAMQFHAFTANLQRPAKIGAGYLEADMLLSMRLGGGAEGLSRAQSFERLARTVLSDPHRETRSILAQLLPIAAEDQSELPEDAVLRVLDAAAHLDALSPSECFMAVRTAKTLLARKLVPRGIETVQRALQSICRLAAATFDTSERLIFLGLLDDMGAAVELSLTHWAEVLDVVTAEAEPGLVLEAVSAATRHGQWPWLCTVGVPAVLGLQRSHVGLIPKERLDSLVAGVRAHLALAGGDEAISAQLDALVDRWEYGRARFRLARPQPRAGEADGSAHEP
jgi:hypothetical protein